MKMSRLGGAAALVAAISGCSGGGSSGSGARTSTIAPTSSAALPTPATPAPTSSSSIAAPVSASLALNQFTVFRELASVADLQVPGGTVLKNRAFALEDRGYVRVLDLSGATPVLDRVIQLDPNGPLATGAAAGSLEVSDDQTALVTTSGQEGVYIFDPGTAKTFGDVTKIDLSTMKVTFNSTLTNSKGVAAPNPMPLTYTASAVRSRGKLFIASSNLDANFDCNPGTVVAFDYDPATKGLSNGTLIVTSCFDPTRLTRWRNVRGDEAVLCVNAGASGKTPSSVDVIDPIRGALVATIPLGNVSAFGAVAITPDGRRGYVGSQSAAEVYELDLSGLETVLNGSTVQTMASRFVGAIKLPASSGLNYVSGIGISNSGKYVYATNFNSSSLAVIDVAARSVAGTLSGFARAGDPTKFQCNASVLAVRPGVPGIDFVGPACFVATVGLDKADQTVPNVTVALDGVSFDKN